jgi:hypothetical protein
MAALVAAIHVFPSEQWLLRPASSVGQKVVDGRHEAGHDGQRTSFGQWKMRYASCRKISTSPTTETAQTTVRSQGMPAR